MARQNMGRLTSLVRSPGANLQPAELLDAFCLSNTPTFQLTAWSKATEGLSGPEIAEQAGMPIMPK